MECFRQMLDVSMTIYKRNINRLYHYVKEMKRSKFINFTTMDEVTSETEDDMQLLMKLISD